jgi:hypothetical protein
MAKPHTKYTPKEIIDWNWTYTSDVDGGYSTERIASAAAVAAAQYLRDIRDELQQIKRDIRQLGAEGLHDLIRYEAKRVRKAERARRTRAAKRRAATIARKKAGLI